MKKTAKSAEQIDLEIEEMFAEAKPTEKSIRELQAAVVTLDDDPQFVADYLKAQFVESVLQVMEVHGLNKNTLATKLGKSRQYVGQILNETANFTLETMAEISCALEMRLDVRMYGPNERVAILPALARPHVVLPFSDSPEFVKEAKRSTYAQGDKHAGHFAA